jgi:hypothetical protein
MNTKLITALRATAKALGESTFHYDWKYPTSCNCGSLFCALTGMSAAELKARKPKPITDATNQATWTTLVGQHCPITGIPHDELFKELFGYGLTQRDVLELEFLSNPKVLARFKLMEKPKRKWYQRFASLPEVVSVKVDFQNKHHVVVYMNAWADLLVEEGKMDVVNNNKEEMNIYGGKINS